MVNARKAAVARKQRESDSAFKKSMEGRTHAVSGSVVLSTTGEALVDVKFPVKFLERPVFSSGGGVLPGSVVTVGAFPRCEGTIVEWITETVTASLYENSHYVGAKLGVTAFGTNDQKFFLDFRFEGVAMVNPVGGVESDELDDEL